MALRADTPRDRRPDGRSAPAPARRAPAPRPGPLRRRAIAEAERWVRERQEADGCWGGIQPPWVWSILMLASLGHGFEDEQLRARGRGLGRVPDRRGRPPAARGVPVAHLGHGARPARPACLRRPGRPPAARQARASGCSARRSGAAATGRCACPTSSPAAAGRSSSRTTSIRTSTTSPSICLALRELGMGEDAVARGLAWMEGMQCVERRLGRVRRRQHERVALPDPVLRLRRGHRPAERGRRRPRGRGARAATREYADATRRGLDYLLARAAATTAPGGAAGASTTSTGPAAVLPALEACGRRRRPSRVPPRRRLARLRPGRRAAASARTSAPTTSREWRGRGVPHGFTNGLGRISLRRGRRGTRELPPGERRSFLCATQLDNGDWSEEHFTGTGFPTDFMIRYHLYRLHFPLMALGRLRERLNA